MTSTGAPPAHPTFPSLYNPTLEVIHFDGRPPVRDGGHYLDDVNDVFRFTFYWTLIFHTPFFLVCGLYAFFNLAFPPARTLPTKRLSSPFASKSPPAAIPLTPIGSHQTPQPAPSHPSNAPALHISSPHSPTSPHPPTPTSSVPLSRFSYDGVSADAQQDAGAGAITVPRRPLNERRTRFIYSLLVLLVFLFADVAGALVESVVVGYVLAGLFKAANFHISTWVPFVWAVILTVAGILGIYPSVIDRI
ncbi:hypothetical protein DENSPDRAFT_834434 [Dentipellis sp. KUC8613]|nr:hypothetical protein DENSPDRAFT_834434 [Dentipellis sp. KUC8613]